MWFKLHSRSLLNHLPAQKQYIYILDLNVNGNFGDLPTPKRFPTGRGRGRENKQTERKKKKKSVWMIHKDGLVTPEIPHAPETSQIVTRKATSVGWPLLKCPAHSTLLACRLQDHAPPHHPHAPFSLAAFQVLDGSMQQSWCRWGDSEGRASRLIPRWWDHGKRHGEEEEYLSIKVLSQ